MFQMKNLVMRFVFIFLFTIVAIPSSWADFYRVNDTSDIPDDDPTDHQCLATVPFLGYQVCTLRAAVMQANYEEANGNPGTHFMGLDPGATYPFNSTLTGPGAASGDLDVETDLNISLTLNPDDPIGIPLPSATIDARSVDRIFHVYRNRSLEILQVNLTGGYVLDNGGGAILQLEDSLVKLGDSEVYKNHAISGGGIENFNGTLEVVDSTFIGNTSELYGGAISSAGRITIENSSFINNQALSSGAGAVLIEGNVVATISHSTFEYNESATSGGALGLVSGASGTVEYSQFTNNRSLGGYGGSIFCTGYTGNQTNLDVYASTLDLNQAPSGGGIYISDDCNTSLINSTISENTCDNKGCGIYQNGELDVEHSTIVNNYTVGSPSYGGGIYVRSTASTTNIDGSILALNSAGSGNGHDCYTESTSQISSSGDNIIGTITDCNVLTIATDLFGNDTLPLDPLIDILNYNGGLTQTHALFTGSPAIDKGACGLSIDQRDYLRDALCDSGSFEVQ